MCLENCIHFVMIKVCSMRAVGDGHQKVRGHLEEDDSRKVALKIHNC